MSRSNIRFNPIYGGNQINPYWGNSNTSRSFYPASAYYGNQYQPYNWYNNPPWWYYTAPYWYYNPPYWYNNPYRFD